MATGLAGRYATALFGLAREGKQIDTVSASLAKVRAALAESEDFRALTASPLIGRGAATSAVLGAAEAMRSEEHTSELQSLMRISYAVFCLKKKKNNYKPIYQNITYTKHTFQCVQIQCT